MASTATVEEADARSRTTDGSLERSGQPDETTPAVPREPDQLPKDVIFGILSNERRRRVLTYLDETGPGATLSDLAEHVASIESDKPVASLSSSERKRVYVGLYQCHLPKMDDANVIDYNQSRGTVELRVEAIQLITYLNMDPDDTNRVWAWLRGLVPTPLHALGTRLVE